MINDVEHIFMYLLAICTSVLEKCLFKSFADFFLLLNCKGSLFFLDINFLSYMLFANIFSHSVGFLFILLIVSFALQKLFSFT